MAMVALAPSLSSQWKAGSTMVTPSFGGGATTLPLNHERRTSVVRCATIRPPVVPPELWDFERTYYPKLADHLHSDKTWYIVDASNKRLGRMASTIAIYLRGKDNPMYTPSLDMGSYVIVVNAEKVGVTGNKRSQKLYRRHSGRPGGLKEETFDQLQHRIPERIVEHAVRGMLPKNRLGRALFRKLKVFTGPDHPHGAQQPIPLPIQDKRINLVNEEDL